MTKARSQFIYQFAGIIHQRSLTKVSPESKHAGQEYYRLKIIQADQSKKTINVFREKLADPQIWETIFQRKYSKGKYLFSCRNVRGYYYLVNWEEAKKEEGQS